MAHDSRSTIHDPRFSRSTILTIHDSKPEVVFDAHDLLVPDLAGQGLAVADVQVRPAQVGRADQRAEAEADAALGVDDGISGGACHVAVERGLLAAESGPADQF